MTKKVVAHEFKFYQTFWSGFNFTREWRWQVRANNGNIIAASSEGYKNFTDCEFNAKSTAASINKFFRDAKNK